MIRRLALALLVALSCLLGSAGAAVAASSPDPVPSFEDCQADPAHYGDFPSCTYDENGKIIDKSYDSDPTGGSGIPGWFVGLFVLALVGAGATTLWRVSMARSMASRAGLDPNEATAVTLLSPDGLDAAYLAANLNRPQSQRQPSDSGHIVADLSGATAPPAMATAPTATPPRGSAERLRELEQLREQNLITTAEYDARRQAILDGI